MPNPKERRKNLAAERAVDSKFYLMEGEAQQHIDPSRIEVRTGSGGTKTAEYLDRALGCDLRFYGN